MNINIIQAKNIEDTFEQFKIIIEEYKRDGVFLKSEQVDLLTYDFDNGDRWKLTNSNKPIEVPLKELKNYYIKSDSDVVEDIVKLYPDSKGLMTYF